MTLLERLDTDLKQAMKAKDRLRMDVIRMVKAAITNKEIEVKRPLEEADTTRVLTTLVKQRRESIDQYQKGGRVDLADKEQKEVTILETYLPQALSPEELARVIEEGIRETGAKTLKDMGHVMKAVMAKLAGQTVDGKQVSELVRSKLQ